MKNFCAFLLYCFSLAVIACDNTEADTSDIWFRDPVVTVDGTTAEVKCLTLFGDGVLASASSCGFVCTPVSGDAATPPRTFSDPEIEGSIIRCTMTGLEPETLYYVCPFAEIAGGRMTGRPAVFETGPAPETPDPAPDPDPDPDPTPDPEPEPDPDPVPQPGSYPGWPELPQEEITEVTTHYVAKHFCPDYTYNGVAVSGLRNYTVCYNADTRTAMWSAYPLHACYKGDVKRTDAWAYDPDILESLQPYVVKSSYKMPGQSSCPYSRGHLLASGDRTASRGMNEQTFYVTNMAPQWQNGFNGGIWGTLEEKCWNNICADTLFVVTGVHFADSSTTVVDNATPTPNPVVVPTNFYKVMIRSKAGNTGKPLYQLKADELQCIAFWFGNESYAGANIADFKTTVADVEQKTGMTFFVNVPNATAEVKASTAGKWSF